MDSQVANLSPTRFFKMSLIYTRLVRKHPGQEDIIRSCVRAANHCLACDTNFGEAEEIVWGTMPGSEVYGVFHERCRKQHHIVTSDKLDEEDMKNIEDFVLRVKTQRLETSSNGCASLKDVAPRGTPPHNHPHRHRSYHPPIGSPPTARRR